MGPRSCLRRPGASAAPGCAPVARSPRRAECRRRSTPRRPARAARGGSRGRPRRRARRTGRRSLRGRRASRSCSRTRTGGPRARARAGAPPRAAQGEVDPRGQRTRRPADDVDMRRLAALTVLLTLAIVPAASAAKLTPPKGKVYTGVTGSKSINTFKQQVGKHPAVFGFFHKWGGPTGFIYDAAEQSGSRLMLHISTQDGYGTKEVITPLGHRQRRGRPLPDPQQQADRRVRQAHVRALPGRDEPDQQRLLAPTTATAARAARRTRRRRSSPPGGARR